MSDGICSDDEKYGGFGAAMANSLAADSAAPARAVAAVRIWKTKGRSKRPKTAPVEMKPPPVLPAALAEAHVPIHPSGIVVEIVGTEMSCQGCSCEEHENCGEVLKEDVVVRLRKIQLMVEGKEETVIAAICVTDGIDRSRVGFVPRHMVRHAARYDGALAQVTRVFSSDPEVCDTAERRVFFKNKGYCRAVIISTLPGSTM
jgi:hypothetical protein